MKYRCNCPKIDGSRYINAEHDWGGYSFYQRPFWCLFHFPIRLPGKINAVIKEIHQKKLRMTEPYMVINQDGLFRGRVLVRIEPVTEFHPEIITFASYPVYSTYYQGDRPDPQTPVQSLKSFLAEKAKVPKSWYFWNLTCPHCVQEKGYRMVVFAAVT
jgi:hypothetical protein